jgi:hypothetical protein
MADYTSLAIHDIRNYLWSSLKSYNILDQNDYYADGFDQPLVPIIPAQQVPEFNNLLPAKTYLVYDHETLPIKQNWWTMDEMVNFMIVSPQYDEVQKIMNFMVDLFRRYDDSATEVRASSILSNNFIFYYTAVEGVKAPQASKQEAGLKVGQINIVYCYSRIAQSTGRF